MYGEFVVVAVHTRSQIPHWLLHLPMRPAKATAGKQAQTQSESTLGWIWALPVLSWSLLLSPRGFWSADTSWQVRNSSLAAQLCRHKNYDIFSILSWAKTLPEPSRPKIEPNTSSYIQTPPGPFLRDSKSLTNPKAAIIPIPCAGHMCLWRGSFLSRE